MRSFRVFNLFNFRSHFLRLLLISPFSLMSMSQPTRQIAPAPLAPVPFNVPQPTVTTLENGLKVVMFAYKRLPLVSLRLAFRSGDANDPSDNVGITSALAAMLTEGTQNYSSRELAEKIERLGA